jgi:hypothetical protein
LKSVFNIVIVYNYHAGPGCPGAVEEELSIPRPVYT